MKSVMLHAMFANMFPAGKLSYNKIPGKRINFHSVPSFKNKRRTHTLTVRNLAS